MSDNISDIVRGLSDRVFRLILRVVGDREEALDLTQEVFVKVLLEHNRSGTVDNPQPYIFRTAFNRALNARRDRRRRSAVNETYRDELLGQNPQPPDSLLEASEESIHLRAALEKLADRQRQSLTLRFYGGLSMAEIAEVMKISEGSVKVHVARGLQNMKKHLLRPSAKEKS